MLGTVGGGGAHREGDLEGEVLLAVGPVILEVGDEGREAGAGPGDAALRHADLDVDAVEVGGFDENLGGFAHNEPDFGVDDGVAEVESDGDAQAFDAAATEPGFPAIELLSEGCSLPIP